MSTLKPSHLKPSYAPLGTVKPSTVPPSHAPTAAPRAVPKPQAIGGGNLSGNQGQAGWSAALPKTGPSKNKMTGRNARG